MNDGQFNECRPTVRDLPTTILKMVELGSNSPAFLYFQGPMRRGEGTSRASTCPKHSCRHPRQICRTKLRSLPELDTNPRLLCRFFGSQLIRFTTTLTSSFLNPALRAGSSSGRGGSRDIGGSRDRKSTRLNSSHIPLSRM